MFKQFVSVYVHSPQQAEEDNEQRKRQEQILMEKLLEQEAMMEEDQKVSHYIYIYILPLAFWGRRLQWITATRR